MNDLYSWLVLFLIEHLKFKQDQVQFIIPIKVVEKHLSSLKILHLVQDIVVVLLRLVLQTNPMYTDL